MNRVVASSISCALAGMTGLLGALWLAPRVTAGPLSPPAGLVTSSYKTLQEVEPRIPVGPQLTPVDGSCRYLINAPGSYYLTGNVDAIGTLPTIRIESDDVTLDLNGFAIREPGPVASINDAIRVVLRNGKPANNVVIRNGIIANVSSAVDADLASGVIEDLVISNCLNYAIALRTNVADGTTPAIRVARCTLRNNGTVSGFGNNTGGIFVQSGALVTDCRIEDTIGIGIHLVNRSAATRNYVSGITPPAGFTASAAALYGDGCTLHDNVLIARDTGVRAVDIEGSNHHCFRNVFGGAFAARGTNSILAPNVGLGTIATATNPFANLSN
ncbi:MAG: hypothetical protein SFZ23_04895 [Planctomycetota bacterium]|nr:hypothetical protein [Planctomycetota bacterium]